MRGVLICITPVLARGQRAERPDSPRVGTRRWRDRGRSPGARRRRRQVGRPGRSSVGGRAPRPDLEVDEARAARWRHRDRNAAILREQRDVEVDAWPAPKGDERDPRRQARDHECDRGSEVGRGRAGCRKRGDAGIRRQQGDRPGGIRHVRRGPRRDRRRDCVARSGSEGRDRPARPRSRPSDVATPKRLREACHTSRVGPATTRPALTRVVRRSTSAQERSRRTPASVCAPPVAGPGTSRSGRQRREK